MEFYVLKRPLITIRNHYDSLQQQSRSLQALWNCHNLHLQCSQKVSFRPEIGPEFPQNYKNPKLLETNLFLSEFVPHQYRKKLFCLFRGGNLLSVSTVTSMGFFVLIHANASSYLYSLCRSRTLSLVWQGVSIHTK